MFTVHRSLLTALFLFYHFEVLDHVVEVVAEIEWLFAFDHHVKDFAVIDEVVFGCVADFEVCVAGERNVLSKEIWFLGGVDK